MMRHLWFMAVVCVFWAGPLRAEELLPFLPADQLVKQASILPDEKTTSPPVIQVTGPTGELGATILVVTEPIVASHIYTLRGMVKYQNVEKVGAQPGYVGRGLVDGVASPTSPITNSANVASPALGNIAATAVSPSSTSVEVICLPDPAGIGVERARPGPSHITRWTSRSRECSSSWNLRSLGIFATSPVCSVSSAHTRKHAAPSAVFQLQAAWESIEPVEGTT